MRATDAGAVEERAVSDVARVSAAANIVPLVRVTAQTCRGREAGSGFVMRGGLVITAAHVVDGAARASIDVDGLGTVPGFVLGVDGGGRDIAVVYVPALADAEGATVAGADLARGTDVAAAGHPRGGVRQTFAGRAVGYVDSGPLAADGGRVLTVSIAFEPGMSGGPVVDTEGRVVGVVIGVERNAGTGIAVPSGAVVAALRGEGLAPERRCGAGS